MRLLTVKEVLRFACRLFSNFFSESRGRCLELEGASNCENTVYMVAKMLQALQGKHMKPAFLPLLVLHCIRCFAFFPPSFSTRTRKKACSRITVTVALLWLNTVKKRDTHKGTIKGLLVTNVPKKSCVFSHFFIPIVLLRRELQGMFSQHIYNWRKQCVNLFF